MFDAAWMMKRFSEETASPIELLEEREAILYLLPQTTPERLHKDFSKYTIDPKTRYPNMNELVPPGDISHLYDSDTEPRPAARSGAGAKTKETSGSVCVRVCVCVCVCVCVRACVKK